MKRSLLLIAAMSIVLDILYSFNLITNSYAIATFLVIFVLQAVVIVTVIGKPKNSNILVLAGLLSLVLIAVIFAHLVVFYLGVTGGIILKAIVVAMFTSAPLTLSFLYLGQYRR